MLYWTVNLLQINFTIHMYQFNCKYATNYLLYKVKKYR